MNPIATWERMSTTDNIAYCPLAFGYSNYARVGYRTHCLSFGAIPSAGQGPVGATLGGAGLAVSAHCVHRDTALEYAVWVAGERSQRTLYVASGGQPGSRTAWTDDAANALTGDYFRNTLPVLEKAWLRPRHEGFEAYQNRGAGIMARFLTGDLTAPSVLNELERALPR
jgi:multiple sugar transport system substrate-binding protein